MKAETHQVEEALAGALKASGWRILKAKGPADLVAKKAGGRVAVDLKVPSGRARLQVLEHSLAAAALMARQHAVELRGGKGGPVEPLAAVGASQLTKGMVGKLSAFAERYLADVPWCIVDAGGVRAVGGVDLEVVEEGGAPSRGPQVSSSTPFSDLGQWLLKVLLAAELDARWIQGGGEVAPFRTARGLAKYAKVSEPVVSVVLRELESRGFLQRRPALRLVDRSRLLRDWAAAVHAKPPAEVAALPMFASKDPIASVSRRLDRDNACLGLFSASEAHGIDFVRGAPKHVVVRKLMASTLEELGLGPCEDEEPNRIVVREAPFPEAVFRGVPSSLPPAADGLQCWLDLVHHPVRGSQLANELWHAMDLGFDQP